MVYWTDRIKAKYLYINDSAILSLIPCLLLFFTLFSFTPARSEMGVKIIAGYSTIRILDPGYDYISDNDFREEFYAEADYKFYNSFSAFGSYCYSGESGNDTVNTMLVTHCAQLGVRYTLSYLKRLQPFVDVGLIYYWGRLTFDDSYSTLKERDYTSGISGNFGIDVYPFKKASLFLKLAMGYALNPSFDNLTLNFKRFGTLDIEGRRYTVAVGFGF
jgi:hypothetical protein